MMSLDALNSKFHSKLVKFIAVAYLKRNYLHLAVHLFKNFHTNVASVRLNENNEKNESQSE